MNVKPAPAKREVPQQEPKIRVAVVFEYGTLNGGEQSMLAVFDQLPASDLEVVAIAPHTGRLADALRDRNVPHIPLSIHDDGRRIPAEQARMNLLTAIRQASPHVVHANSLSMGRLTGRMPACRTDTLTAGEIKCIAHLRDIIKLSRSAVADLNGNRLLLAVSRSARDFHASQGVDAQKLQVVYNGVDCKRFRPRPPTGSLKKSLGVPDDGFLIATIGQIGLRKGQDVLAAAASRVAGDLPNSHFLLIGERNSRKPESIEFERNVARRFDDAGLSRRFHRLGYRDDVPRLLNEVDLLVHPAHQEPLGRVLLEAAASELPIIATRVGGTPEILVDGESARLVPPNDEQALARAIVELYGSPELRARFGAAARATVHDHFNIVSAAERLFALWKSQASP